MVPWCNVKSSPSSFLFWDLISGTWVECGSHLVCVFTRRHSCGSGVGHLKEENSLVPGDAVELPKHKGSGHRKTTFVLLSAIFHFTICYLQLEAFFHDSDKNSFQVPLFQPPVDKFLHLLIPLPLALAL